MRGLCQLMFIEVVETPALLLAELSALFNRVVGLGLVVKLVLTWKIDL